MGIANVCQPPCRHIKDIVEGPPYRLLEAVAEKIATGILESDARVAGVHISVCKPHVAVGGVVESLGVHVMFRLPACCYNALTAFVSSCWLTSSFSWQVWRSKGYDSDYER